MCLSRVLEIVDAETWTTNEQWLVGYKVVDMFNGEISSPLMHTPLGFKQVLSSVPNEPISPQAYTMGFHIFTNMNDAFNYRISPEKVVKVSYRKLYASGYEFVSMVDVAHEMIIEEILG